MRLNQHCARLKRARQSQSSRVLAPARSLGVEALAHVNPHFFKIEYDTIQAFLDLTSLFTMVVVLNNITGLLSPKHYAVQLAEKPRPLLHKLLEVGVLPLLSLGPLVAERANLLLQFEDRDVLALGLRYE